MNNSNINKSNISRWDQLYSLDKMIQNKKEIKKFELDVKRQQDEIKECTFNPFLNRIIQKE